MRAGVAIPERWDAARFAFAGENIVDGSDDFCGIGSNALVCALRNRQRRAAWHLSIGGSGR